MIEQLGGVLVILSSDIAGNAPAHVRITVRETSRPLDRYMGGWRVGHYSGRCRETLVSMIGPGHANGEFSFLRVPSVWPRGWYCGTCSVS